MARAALAASGLSIGVPPFHVSPRGDMSLWARGVPGGGNDCCCLKLLVIFLWRRSAGIAGDTQVGSCVTG